MPDLKEIFSFKVAIFDMDGTLIDSEPYHLKAWQAVCTKYSLPLMTPAWQKQVQGMDSVRVCQKLCADCGRSGLDFTTMAQDKNDFYQSRFLKMVPLCPHIASLLEQSHARGLKTAVASGSYLNEVHYILEKYSLLQCVDVIVTSEQVKHAKPEPDTFLTCAQRLGVEPGECLVLEDALLGLQGAKAAQMTALQVAQDRIISDFIKP